MRRNRLVIHQTLVMSQQFLSIHSLHQVPRSVDFPKFQISFSHLGNEFLCIGIWGDGFRDFLVPVLKLGIVESFLEVYGVSCLGFG